MACTIELSERNRYVDNMANRLLKDYVIDIGEEIINLWNKMPLDNILIIDDLYDIRDMYYKKFKAKFTPKSRKGLGI